MKALELLSQINLYIAALEEMTQQLVDLSNYQDKPNYYDTFNAIDYARVATQEKIAALVKELEAHLRSIEGAGA